MQIRHERPTSAHSWLVSSWAVEHCLQKGNARPTHRLFCWLNLRKCFVQYMLARNIHLMEEGTFCAASMTAVSTNWMYFLAVLEPELEDKLHKTPVWNLLPPKSLPMPRIQGFLNQLWLKHISELNIYCSAPLACNILIYTHIPEKKKNLKVSKKEGKLSAQVALGGPLN